MYIYEYSVVSKLWSHKYLRITKISLKAHFKATNKSMLCVLRAPKKPLLWHLEQQGNYASYGIKAKNNASLKEIFYDSLPPKEFTQVYIILVA